MFQTYGMHQRPNFVREIGCAESDKDCWQRVHFNASSHNKHVATLPLEGLNLP